MSAAMRVGGEPRAGRPPGWLWYGGWLSAVMLDATGFIAMYQVTGNGFSAYWVVSRVLTAASLEVVGLMLWRRHPNNPIGMLLLVAGLTGMAQHLVLLPNATAFVVGLVAQELPAAAVAHAVLTFPDGRLRTRAERVFVLAVYCLPLLLQLATALFARTAWLIDCRRPRCVTNPLLIRLDGRLAMVLSDLYAATFVGLGAALAALLAVRVWRSDADVRRAYRPTLAAMAVLITSYAARVAVNSLGGQAGWQIIEYAQLAGGIALPFAMAYGLQRARADVADLLTRLERCPPERVWDELAAALGDPTLRVALRRPGGDFVDPAGRPIDVDDPTRERTVIDQDTVLLHDPAPLDHGSLLRAGAAAARLSLDNRRLQAEVRAQLLEVQQSRTRLARAAFDERRRLERDLHDGAQQRLIAVGLSIDHARQQLGDDPVASRALDQAATEVMNTLAELRQLARGLRPALLEERGLAGAIPVLVRRIPLPVRLEVAVDTRLPEGVEATAYFVVSETLQNTAKHARAAHAEVAVKTHQGRLRVRVSDDGIGGADPSQGTGLRGIADRVAAIAGTITITSPPGCGTTVLAVLPCAVAQDA